MTLTRYMPVQIVAGESIWVAAENTVQQSRDLFFDNFTPAGGYTLAYRFAAATPITVGASANTGNTGYTLDVTAAITLTWRAGAIAYAGMVTHTASGRIYSVESGAIAVIASPLATSAWTAIVAQCDVKRLTIASNPYGSINIGESSISFRGADQLIDLRNYARNMERLETGARMPRIIRSRFT